MPAQNISADTIYLGGGTPSVFGKERLKNLIENDIVNSIIAPIFGAGRFLYAFFKRVVWEKIAICCAFAIVTAFATALPSQPPFRCFGALFSDSRSM